MLAGATVTGDVGIDGALTVDGTDVTATIAALEARITQLETLLAGVTRDGDLLTFSAMNVAIVNGQGATATTNGLGNLIVGYNKDHTEPGCQPSPSDCQYGGDNAADTRSGSHNLIIGVDHTYTSSGGLVAGHDNTISGIFASVTGGSFNTASGGAASVSGGRDNNADASFVSVAGGRDGTVSDAYDSRIGNSSFADS